MKPKTAESLQVFSSISAVILRHIPSIMKESAALIAEMKAKENIVDSEEKKGNDDENVF